MGLLLLHQRFECTRRSSSTCRSTTKRSGGRSACHRLAVHARAGSSVSTRLTTPRFQQLIESRDAQFGAVAGVAFAEGFVVRYPVVRESLFKGLTERAVVRGPSSSLEEPDQRHGSTSHELRATDYDDS